MEWRVVLSTNDIIQLYTPLVGLAMLAFWSGVLTQRLTDVIRRLTKIEAHADADTAIAVQLGVVTERVGTLQTSLVKLDVDVQRVRQSLDDILSRRHNDFEQR